MRPINEELKRSRDKESLHYTFSERVLKNLHIILCMSHHDNTFRLRCRNFPSIINRCSIDFLSIWTDSALVTVANKRL